MACLHRDTKASAATVWASVIFFHLVFLSPLALSCPNGSCAPPLDGPTGGGGGGMILPPLSPLPVDQPPPAPVVDEAAGSPSPSLGTNPVQSPVNGALTPPLPFGNPFGGAAQQGAVGLGNSQQKPFGGAYQQQPGSGGSGFGQQPLNGNQLPFGGAGSIGAGGWIQLGLAAVFSVCASGFFF